LQVRAQGVLANIQAVPQAPVPVLPPPQGPQGALATPANEAAVENAVAGNQNPGLPEPPIEVNFGFIFSCSPLYLTVFFSAFILYV